MKSLSFKTNNITVLQHPYIMDVLIYDIETDSLDTDTAKVKWFGAYSYKFQKYYIYQEYERGQMQKIMDLHRVLVGFNNVSFDNEILISNHFNVEYHTIMDLYRVLYNPDTRKYNKKLLIQLPDGKNLAATCASNKLKDICIALNFDVQKGDIDYKIFRQNTWTPEQIIEIEKYLYYDVNITRQLFEYLLTYFDNLREFVSDDNIRRFHYIKSSLGSFTYSAICHLSGLKEEYGVDSLKRIKYKGAFVKDVTVPEAHGKIFYLDFASLYPHIFIQCNLFTPFNETIHKKSWNGDNFFTVKGIYSADTMGKIETLLYNMLKKRIEWKKTKDPRQLPLKIILNTGYGITGNPNFIQVHHEHNAEDCTQIGVGCVQYAMKVFEDNGFKVLYGDTDSAFVQVPIDYTMEQMRIILDSIITDLKSHMPFNIDTWKIDLEEEIKHIWWGGKKNYVYISSKNKLIIKGLPIIKNDGSLLGKKILDILKPLIIENQSIKFNKLFIENLIMNEIRKDITIIGQLYSVRSPVIYKSKSSIQFQIADKFGEGNFLLIPNKTLGTIGKVKKYCTPDEALTLSISDLILEKVWSELEPFIINPQQSL